MLRENLIKIVEDRGSNPSKSMLKFLNSFFLNFCFTFNNFFLCLEENLCGVLYYYRVFYCRALPTE